MPLQYCFYLRFFFRSWLEEGKYRKFDWGWRRKLCLYIKGWFKPIFPLSRKLRFKISTFDFAQQMILANSRLYHWSMQDIWIRNKDIYISNETSESSDKRKKPGELVNWLLMIIVSWSCYRFIVFGCGDKIVYLLVIRYQLGTSRDLRCLSYQIAVHTWRWTQFLCFTCPIIIPGEETLYRFFPV